MPKELSFTGTSDKAWKKENSQKLEKIWLPLKRTMKKSELKLLKEKEKKKDDQSVSGPRSFIILSLTLFTLKQFILIFLFYES